MLYNHFKIALRHLWRNKSLSFINIFGLAVGVGACVLMLVYVHHELSYDQFHEKGDRTYRVAYSYKMDGKDGAGPKMPFPTKAALVEEFPEIESVVRFYNNAGSNNHPILKYGEKVFTEKKFLFADPEVFSTFDFKMVAGSAEAALDVHQNVLLTQSTAERYFGNENPIGKVIRYQNETDLTVAGVVEDVPGNSHIQFDFLAPINLQRFKWKGGPDGTQYDLETDWNWAGCWLFVTLRENVDVAAFSEKIQVIAKRHFDEEGKAAFTLHLEPLADLHFKAHEVAEMSAGGNKTQVYGLVAIAFLILLMACFNFMNFESARSTERSMEVGVRRVLGARRRQLTGQFLGEAFLTAFMAVCLGALLAELLLPTFNFLTGKSLIISWHENPMLIVALLGGGLLTGLLAGVYPAFFQSRFKPVQAFRGMVEKEGFTSIFLRKSLIVSQFGISIMLIIGVLVIGEQLDFMKNKDLGFAKTNTVVFQNGWKISDSGNYDLFRAKLEAVPGVGEIYRGYVPGKKAWSNAFTFEGKPEPMRLAMRHVGVEFFDFFDITAAEGRVLSEGMDTDSSQVAILNESAARQTGWAPSEVVGKTVSYTGGNDNQTVFNLQVVGVVKDANFESLHREAQPMIFAPATFGEIAVKIEGENMPATLSGMEAAWKEVLPDWPFEYAFLDETFALRYEKEEKLGEVIQGFSFLAIFIACLGLFGLAALMANQRTKEIGIRKVLGATTAGLVGLLSKDFLSLVLLSLVIASPVAWHFLNGWLDNFAYRIDIGWGVFALAGLAAVAVAFFTVGFHSVRAALANPVESLRSE